MLSILLLDCSKKLAEDLSKQGFNIQAGTVGYATGIRSLPSQIYEHNVIIYNPPAYIKGQRSTDITILTPEFSLEPLLAHIQSGATCLVFINRVSDNITCQRLTYDWIPCMPQINFTKDSKVQPATPSFLDRWDCEAAYCNPLISEYDLKKPVLQKLSVPTGEVKYEKCQFVWLYSNFNEECLGVLIRHGKGELIILPQYESNDDIIRIFVRRVIPKLYKIVSRKDLLVDFKSPEEEKQEALLNDLTTERANLEEKHEKALETLAEIKRNKINTINADNAAKLALQYLDLAYQQEDVALHYLYKVAEVIEKKLGGEKEAKKILNTHTERNFIGTVANESYGDMRHAPSPGEIIKPWSEEQIKKCFADAEIIICKYLATLFKS